MSVSELTEGVKGSTACGGAVGASRLRGNTSRHSPAPSYSPFDCSLHSQPLSPFHGDNFWLTVARQPRSSTQKFIVETASEKKVRHLACFDDSDASDAECAKPLE